MFNYDSYIKDLLNFMADKGFTKKPFPKIVLKNNKQDGLFIKTGYYSPDTKTVCLFINGRHPKDVLRSLAHEMIHHMQNMEGRLSEGTYSGEEIINDEKLEKLEAEAYMKGNISFRRWTETVNKK